MERDACQCSLFLQKGLYFWLASLVIFDRLYFVGAVAGFIEISMCYAHSFFFSGGHQNKFHDKPRNSFGQIRSVDYQNLTLH